MNQNNFDVDNDQRAKFNMRVRRAPYLDKSRKKIKITKRHDADWSINLTDV